MYKIQYAEDHLDETWSFSLSSRSIQSVAKRVQVIHIRHCLHVPSVRLIALVDVLGEGQVRAAVNGDPA